MKVTLVDDWKSRMSGFSDRAGNVPVLPFLGIAKEYHVYGIGWRKDSYYYSGSPVVYIFDNDNNLVMVPLAIFDIIEGWLPTQWRASGGRDSFLICPDLFRAEFFFDDFSDKEPGLVEAVEALRREIEGVRDASEGSD